MFAAMLPSVPAVHDVMAEVVPEVAALAPPAKVEESIVVFVSIDVGCS